MNLEKFERRFNNICSQHVFCTGHRHFVVAVLLKIQRVHAAQTNTKYRAMCATSASDILYDRFLLQTNNNLLIFYII